MRCPLSHDYEVFGAKGPKVANSKLGAETKSRLAPKKDEEKPDDGSSEVPKMGLRDLLALAVAALETFLLPLLAIAVVIALIAILLKVRP
ncbi:MAG: hypothetical protein OK452_07700 [Thaumarchaeota archaeon]|nr:hypothetical protein [Nitrososphaerota archaeon]